MEDEKPRFRNEYVIDQFEKLADAITERVNVFMIGGGALIFHGLKEGTKDVDVIVQTPSELKALISALYKIGYKSARRLPREYEELGASIIVENPDHFRWDIFHMQVANGLVLSENMITRSTVMFEKKGLAIHQMSKEDIFIFKSVTEREADLEDMRVIAEAGIDWKIVLREIKNQSDSSGRLWENALYEDLKELKKKHGIYSPIQKKVENALAKKLEERAVIRQLENGKRTIEEIASSSKELSRSLIRSALQRLEEKGKVTINRKRKPFVIHLKK